MRKSLYILIFILFAVSCKKDDDVETVCRLLSVTEISPSLTFTTEYTYENDRITKTTSTRNGVQTLGTFTYDAEGRISEMNDPLAGGRLIFTYTNGNITRKEVQGNNPAIVDYEYSTKGQLTKIQYYNYQQVKANYSVLEYADANSKDPIRLKYYNSPSDTSPYATVEYTYGAQRYNFFATPVAYQKYVVLAGLGLEHNVIQVQSSTSGSIGTYTYEFNEYNYPVTRITTSTGQQTTTRTYIYDCK